MQKTYFNGLPTDLDIRRIRDQFPDDALNCEQKISHEEIEQIIECSRDSYRYKTVTARWRKLVENSTNKIIGADRGTGFIVLSEPGKLDLSGDKLR